MSTLTGDETQWNTKAVEVLAELTRGKTLSAQVAGYTESGLPEVLLYCHLAANVRTSSDLDYYFILIMLFFFYLFYSKCYS